MCVYIPVWTNICVRTLLPLNVRVPQICLGLLTSSLMILRQLCALREHDCRKNQYLDPPRHTHTNACTHADTQNRIHTKCDWPVDVSAAMIISLCCPHIVFIIFIVMRTYESEIKLHWIELWPSTSCKKKKVIESPWECVCVCVFPGMCACVTYFSISLFLQVRGTQEEEEEDEGVPGSVLLLSPLLVEGISVNTHTHTQVTWLTTDGDFSSCNKHSHTSLPNSRNMSQTEETEWNEYATLLYLSVWMTQWTHWFVYFDLFTLKWEKYFWAYLPSLAHLENSGVILLEGIPPL